MRPPTDVMNLFIWRLMLGLDLGATIGIPIDTWRDDFGPVSGIPSPGTVVSPYLRLTLGGGGFRKHMPVQ